MNATQRKIVAVAAIVMVAMLVYPPYQLGNGFSLSAHGLGYAFIGSPPFLGSINFALLVVQWLAVAFLGAVLFFVSGSRR